MHDAASLLRQTRLSAGLTQAELAARAGITQSVVSRAEAPGANPRVSTLHRLLRAAGADLKLSASKIRLPDVDESQILEQLQLSVAERLHAHDAARASIRELMSDVRILN